MWASGNEPGHERFSGEFSVRIGAERLGRIDLDQVFSRHPWTCGWRGERFPFATCAEFAWVALPHLGELIRESMDEVVWNVHLPGPGGCQARLEGDDLGHGDTAFTVPRFGGFMRRIMPGRGWRT